MYECMYQGIQDINYRKATPATVTPLYQMRWTTCMHGLMLRMNCLCCLLARGTGAFGPHCQTAKQFLPRSHQTPEHSVTGLIHTDTHTRMPSYMSLPTTYLHDLIHTHTHTFIYQLHFAHRSVFCTFYCTVGSAPSCVGIILFFSGVALFLFCFIAILRIALYAVWWLTINPLDHDLE